MTKRNTGTIIAIIVVVAAVMFFLMAKITNTVNSIAKDNKEKTARELSAQLENYDYMVYWIGIPPEGLSGFLGDRLTVLTIDQINEDTLPVGNSVIGVVQYDENGNPITGHTRSEYPQNLLIVVNTTLPLSEDQMETVRTCVVGNRVPLLLIGDTQISAFRSMMLMSSKIYNENSTMLYTLDNGIDPVVLSPEDVEAGGRQMTEAVIRFTSEVFALAEPTPVYIEPEYTGDSVTETDSVIIEESTVATEMQPGETTEETQQTGWIVVESTVIYFNGN